ncbi:hypothetical protein ABIF64_006652 [Bradyrhizobium japonicum]|nr:hypothetical protein [Bradyrhizobium japonicum]MCP1787668.1 hypothetical protein [Bradyrhizobium japonicum]MCP1809544.1 hypothetical protein [Bradyrhizobium japonicum]MCP1818478.1 hypothetical protein [Bradyrhizobium japonicum]MCP1870012.1 hypothetical protein [Bradyrhizobium japonicum]
MTDSALTRRRSDNSHQETWYIYFDDVRVGTISERAGVPVCDDRQRIGTLISDRIGRPLPGAQRTNCAQSEFFGL